MSVAVAQRRVLVLPNTVGDAFTPGPYLGPHPSFMQATLDALDAGQTITITPDLQARFAADLQSRQ